MEILRGVVNVPTADVDTESVIEACESGTVTYPYSRYFMTSPLILFEELKMATLDVEVRAPIERDLDTNMEVSELTLWKYEKGEELVDYYIEPERALVSTKNSLMSRRQLWEQMTREVVTHCLSRYDRVNTYSLAESLDTIGKTRVKDADGSHPAYAFALRIPGQPIVPCIYLFHQYCPQDGTLIASIGWGETLVAAAASGVVGRYVGVGEAHEVNRAYGIREMGRDLAGSMPHSFYYDEMPDTAADLVYIAPTHPDLVNVGDTTTWLAKLVANCESLYRHVVPGGHFALQLRDTPSRLVEPIHTALVTLGATLENVIGYTSGGTIQPVWVWRVPK